MNLPLLLPALTAALAAGLLGSGHCFGMCGGIAGSLGALGTRRDSRTGRSAALSAALLFNGGRIASYMLLGALVASVFGLAVLQLPALGSTLRLITALLIALIGLQLLTGWRALALLERAGGVLWQGIAPWAIRLSARPGMAPRFALGMCWGLLPCGLVYTALAAASATGGMAASLPGRMGTGALVMLAFGLGTLPSMLGLTLAVPALGALLAERRVRQVTGLALLLLAVWTLLLAWPGGVQHQH